ncbi:zinc ribbon domain-containing protein [Clostridium vincentii]|uniref:Yip1 domain protein n=1 Tax=Clostridium vincentii TaxID=52704 RepID=A0A2T0BIF1_9CLOT|nr:zinc ribbon domain-containing protein [Clostridium vincentii]PRR83582.1 Yip1 domain protein [Clostridium vincentii]
MFCKNCGSQIAEGDGFCGNCGQPGENQKGIKQDKPRDLIIIKLIKTYFIKPLSFFSELKNDDTVKTSVGLLAGLSIIYGLINILYTSSLINSFFSMFNKLPDILSKSGIISAQEAITAKQELLLSSEVVDMKNNISAFVDNKDVFLNGTGQVVGIIILTGIILAIINSVILKNRMSYKDILIISTASYIPLVLSLGVATIVTFISATFGAFILISGYILSFITIYSGIRQLSEEKNDKVFIIMAILFIVVSAVLAIFVTKQFESSIMEISNAFETMGSFI